MMTEQNEALRLADELDGEFVQGRISNHTGRKAAAELRRLEIQRDALLEALKFYENAGSELSRLVAQRDQLLAELKSLVKSTAPICDGSYGDGMDNDFLRARTAIKAVEEE